MKKLLLGLALIAAGHTAWADAVADKIAAGRAALIAHDLPTAHARFQEAYDLDTDHTNQTASALLGITRVIDVTSQSASGTFMDGLGFTGSRDPYNWTAGIAHDVNGNPVVPANYNLTTVASFWQNTLVPESVAARGNLAQVTNSSFLLTLSSAETKMPMALNIDYGDILMMQACLRAAEFLAHMGSGQNLDLNLDAALQAMQGNMLTVQKVLSDNPNLLTAGDSSERAAGQAALLDMISLYRQASTFIRNRPAGVSRLFMLTAADLPQEAQFRQMLDRLEQSVTAPVDLNGKSVYTAPLFGGTWSVRAQLPTFTATGFDVTTIPDATLGGILSGFTKEALAAALSNQHDTVAEIGWSWVTPQPMGNTLYKYLALPDGHHLVTGNGGTSLTSSDGTNWTYHRIPGIGQFVDVACDATGHLAGVTADGFIFYSTDDGASWQRVYRSDTGFNAVAYGGGKFVAVGYWGMVVTSTDGQHWSEVSSTGYSNYRLLYTGSQFVLGSQDDVTQNAVMLTSPDGLSWTERFNSNLSGASVFGLAQNGSGVIVGVLTSGGQELTSTNGGTSWSVGPGPGVASGITYSLGKFVAVGSQTLQVETATAVGTITTAGNASITVTGAGITGSPLTIPVPVNLNDTASTWAAAVRTALGGTPAITSLYTVGGTGTAITLTRIVAAANDNTLNIAIANGTAAGITAAPTSNNTISGSLTGGTGTIRVSSDNGATWTTATSASANGLTNAFAGTGATYVLGVGGLIQSSTDNATFTRALTLTTAIPTIGNKGLLALKAMDGKLFVGGGGGSNGSGTIFYSSDGQSFTEATLPGTQNNITDFLRVNSSLYYAVGNGGLILKSTDGGLNWTSVSSGTTSNILSITYLNGQFLATAAGSRVLVSADGTTWTNYSLPIGGMQMNGIAYGNGTYVAVGGSNNSGSPFSYVLTSTTAASGSWTQRNVPTTETLKGIVFNNGVFTAVGTGGTIVRSTDGVNWWGAGGKLGTNVTCISVLNGRYYAGLNLANLDSSHLISQSAVLISSNGDDWVQVPLGTANTPNRVELFNNRLYTANGNATIMRSESLPAESAPVVNVLTPNTTAPQGHTVTLAVGVPAGGGLTYQWKKDGNAVSGATGSDLVLNNVQSGDGGSYTVDVTNAAGTTTSAAITLGVSGTPSAPTIVSQPESQTVHTGFDASFSVEATGTTPFTYVWTKDGVTVTDGGNVSGATTDTLVITGATAANAGRYQVTVGNGAGNTPSLPADLVVDSVPAYNYTTLAGSPGQFATTDGTGGTARFDKPWGVAVDASGNVYVSSPQSHTIRKVTSAGVVTTIAGQAYTSGSTDATGTAARFNMPYGIALNPAGTVLYIADNGNGKIRMLDLTTLAVTTLTSSASTVNALVVDSSGNVYYTAYDHTVRKVTSGGSVSVFAGSAGAPSFANGTGSGARFNTPQGITMDAAGTYLYVADTGNGVIRRILVANQSVTTYAGQPNAFGSDDGSAAGAKFGGPLGIAIDSSGNVYVADDYADTIRKIGANGFVVTIGGQPYADGFNNAADGDARFAGPAGLAVDGSGNLFLAEQYNQIIRKGAPAGSLTAPVIWLSPQALTLNAGNTAVFGAVASGTTTLSYQWLKNGVALTDGGNVSGSATAVLTLTNIQPGDAAGYAVVVTGNGTARSAAAQLAVTVPPTISAQPSAQSLSAGGTINLSVTATDTGDITYQWRRNGFAIPGAIGSSYSLSNAQAGDGGTYDVLITGINGTITSTPVNVTVAPSNYPGVLAPDTTYPANPLLTLSTRIYAVIPLSGGKWMVGGEFVQWDATPRTFLARLNSDFSLDLGFTPPALNNYVYALAAASDGSVYVGGDFTSVDGNLVPGLFRLDSSGAYDRSWRPRDNPPAGGVSALAVQSDGKLLVARQSLSTGEPVPANTDILRRLNTDGTLDGTFSVNINANNNFNNKLVAVFVESNGSIAFGGNFTAVNGSSRGGVARVDSTGATLDTAFGGTQGANNMVYSMTQVSGGGYLIAGTFGSVAGSARNKVAIINGDGSLNAFAPPSINGNVLGAAQDANGKIVVTGTFTTVNGQATDGVVRLTAGGSVDTLYPSAATTTINTTSRSSFVFPLSDGRIALFGAFTALLNQPRIGMGVLAADGSVASSPAPLLYRPAYDGTAYPVTGGKSVVFGSIDLVGSTITNQAVQLNDDGSLDGSFPQGSGFVLNGLSRFGVYKAILQGDGKYLVVGDLVGYNGNPAYRMMRVNADGSFDSSFNVQGGPSTVFPPMIGLSGGRTLLYNLSNGYTFNGQGVGALVRLNEDGSRDTSFPLGAGLLNGTNNATVTFAAEQPDGKLLLAGTMTTYNGTTVTGNVIRLNEDGSLDSSFNPGSGVSAGSITTGVVLPDGSAILAGSFTSYNGTPVNRVVKIMANGTIDPGFTAPAAIDNTVGQVVAQADGKFILVGDFVNTPAPYAVRLNSNGTVDNTFALTGLTGGFGSSARIFLGDDGSVYVYNNPVSYNYGVPLAYARFRGAPVAPGVATQPAAVSTTVGGKATFYVKASGTAPFSYQWRKNGTPLSNSATIDGANYSILNLTNVAAGDAGNYDVLITSPFGGPVTSNAVALTVGSLLPTIDTQPVSASVNAGQETSLTVAVSGTGPFHYQWRRNGVNVGTDSATLDFPNPTVADAGAYTVVITNGNGSTTSATATLTVNLAPAAGVEAVDQGFVRPEFRRTSLPGRVTKGINGEVYLTWSNASSVTGANNVRLGAVVRVSANGTLDPSFAPGSFLADAWAIVPLANGQLLVGGLASSETYESGQPAYRVFRLNADGSRDASYGSPVFTSIPRYMTLQADGKLLVAPSGGFYPNGGLSNLVRLNQDGSVDSGFTSPTFDVTNSIFATVLVDGSGNIIIGGTFKTVNGTTVPGIARLQANGTLDGTFLPSGFTSTATVQVRGLGLQTQGGNAGKILVAGSGLKVSGTAYPVIRLNANGSLDNSFTLQPTATVIGANGVRPRLLNVLADDSFTTVSATVTKFDANGNLAAGYNQPVFSNESYWMETLADGSVLVAPEYGTTVNGTPVNGPFRLTNTGGLDSGFTPPAPFQTEVYPNNFTIQPDGKVLIWGNFDTVNSMARHGMALIGPDGSLDSFNLSGVPNLYSVAGAFRFADGHILANTLVGTYQNNLGGGVVRFNANGTVDSGFSLAPSVNGNGIEPLPDGHILAGGMDTATLLAGGPVLQRVDSSGALDGSFTGPNASAFGAVYRTGGSPSTITSFVQGVFSIAGHYDDGRALVIATVPNGSYPANATSLDMTLVRIKTDGSIDTGFTAPVVPWSTVSAFTVPLVDPQNTGLGAQQYQGVFVNGSPFSGVVPQSDGGVIVFGIFTNIGGHAAPGIARLKNDGSFDTGFSVGTGPALSAPAGRSPQVESVDVAPDGSYWITGVFDSFNGTPAPGIVKLKADGTVDTSLATTIGYRPYLGTGTKVRIGASGEIYVAGTFAQGFDLLPYGLHRLVGTVAPTIATQPQSQSATIGSDVTFSVTASPGLNVAYQWFKNGSQIAGANSSTLLLKNVQAGDAASYTVTLTNAVNYVTSNAATLSFGSTFSTWQQSKFTAGELLDSNISGPNAVYGQDGLPNILKYGLGLEPKQNITTGLPTVTTSGGNWVYTYVRPDNITDVTYQVEYSTDLTTWYTLSDVSIGDSGGLDTRQAVYPLSATNIYFRLRVSQP